MLNCNEHQLNDGCVLKFEWVFCNGGVARINDST